MLDSTRKNGELKSLLTLLKTQLRAEQRLRELEADDVDNFIELADSLFLN